MLAVTFYGALNGSLSKKIEGRTDSLEIFCTSGIFK
jgi:hypothetical protein